MGCWEYQLLGERVVWTRGAPRLAALWMDAYLEYLTGPPRRRRRRAPSGAVAVISLAPWLAGGCGEPSARERFESDVVPVLEGSCAGTVCHGVAPDAEARGEVIDWTQLQIRVTADGRIADLDQAYAITKSRIDTIGRPELSTLLRKPLGGAAGTPHLGGAAFTGRDDPRYRAIRGWIEIEDGGGEGGRIEDLPPAERRFAEDVLPRLAALQCMNAACHGPVAPFTSFQPPVEIDGDLVFPFDAVRADYAAARMHLFLGGDPRLSRLVRKGLPLERGGIAHRGGNGIFFNQGAGDDPASDPTVAAIVGWADMEREAALGPGLPEVRGIVLVRGPLAAEAPFAHDCFAPGSDLFVLEPPVPGGALRNLTAAAHPDGPADVRDPAVSHDGRRIAFSMRRGPGDAQNIYEIGVDGGGLRQLTHDAGPLPGGGRAANVEPTYGPDGRVYFVSTRAGHLTERGDAPDAEIWAVHPDGGEPERITHDPAPEAAPVFFGVGKSYGTLAFTVLRAEEGGDRGIVFRAPLDHNKHYHGDPELHIHHGLTAPGEVLYGARATPDGRFVAALLDRGALWRGGRLAALDRQLGPEIPAGAEAEASVGGYRRAFALLDAPAPAGAAPFSMARRPVPLPDGRVLVTLGADPIDDPAAPPELGVHVLTIEEDPASGGPRVVAREALLDEAGIAERDAEPIVARPLEDDPSHELAWEPGAATGRLAYRHVETLEAIMSSLGPLGPKPLRGDLAYARLIEASPVTPADLAAGPISAGARGRSRILAEVPLAGGSLFLEVPAGAPLRVQTLDADRMARGTQHRRWIDVAPGQLFPGGVAPELYPTLCAGCHGSLSGAPGDSGGPVPDAITAASMTLATHEGLDPRRPLPPTPVGGAPIEIDFRRDVLPILERSCAGCHAGPSAAGGLDLQAHPTASFDSAYEALLAVGPGSGGGRRYVDEAGASARSSYLVERIYGRELDAPRPLGAACPGDPPLGEEERLTIVRWIELGAVYRGVAP